MTTATLVTHVRTIGRRRRRGPGAAWRSWSTGSSRRCSERKRRRQSRARRGRSTRRGGSGRRGTWTAALAVLRRHGRGEGDAERGPVGFLRVEEPGEAAVRRPGSGGLQPGDWKGRSPGAPPATGRLRSSRSLGMRWRSGKVVSERSLRGLRPLGGACP